MGAMTQAWDVELELREQSCLMLADLAPQFKVCVCERGGGSTGFRVLGAGGPSSSVQGGPRPAGLLTSTDHNHVLLTLTDHNHSLIVCSSAGGFAGVSLNVGAPVVQRAACMACQGPATPHLPLHHPTS